MLNNDIERAHKVETPGMRVLSVIHAPAFGGAHNQALRLDAPLRERGVETVVALPEDAGPAAERLRSGGLDVHLLPLRRLRETARPDALARFLASIPGDVGRLAGLADQTGADVVQVHAVQNPQAALAGRRSGAAVVWQLLDTRAPPTLRRAMMPLVARYADAVASWGEGVASQHPGARRFGDRLIVVYPPVQAGELTPDPERRREARERLGVRAEQQLVATVGVRYPPKGHLDFVRAAALVRRRRPQVAFRIIGAPSPAHPGLDDRLRAEANELGLAMGEAFDLVDPGVAVATFVQGIDVFVMTSPGRSEGMPTAILEAMVAAKPVVATDVGATRELVVEGETGLLAPPGEPDRIADAVLRLLDDERARAAFGAAGRRRALERFDLDALADRHMRAYEVALAHRQSRRR
jgi:glycosyltransferase involved in cell wall biosynthesis